MVAGGAASFDAVVSAEVIQYLYNPRPLLSNAYALLRFRALFIATTPYHSYWKNLALPLSGRLDAHFTALWDGGHIKFWSRRTLEAVLREAGFRVSGFHGARRLPWLWKSMVVQAVKR